jgi:branched-chain amino acid transport system permease protein
MTLSLMIELMINGLAIGSVYILIVLGIDIILRGTKILNFAHGQLYMLGAYFVFIFCKSFNMNFFMALIFTLVALGVMGIVIYLSVFNFVRKKFTASTTFSYRLLISAMASVGLMMILQQGVLIVFGTSAKGLPPVFPQVLHVAGVPVVLERLVVMLLSILICFGLYLLMFNTKLGKVIRAVSYDAEPVAVQGVNTSHIFILCFALGSALAGFAGGVIAPIFGITPGMGEGIMNIAFLVLLVGGIGSYLGTILGGILIGLMMSFGFQYLGGISLLLIFTLVIMILVFRPGGLLGEIEI